MLTLTLSSHGDKKKSPGSPTPPPPAPPPPLHRSVWREMSERLTGSLRRATEAPAESFEQLLPEPAEKPTKCSVSLRQLSDSLLSSPGMPHRDLCPFVHLEETMTFLRVEMLLNISHQSELSYEMQFFFFFFFGLTKHSFKVKLVLPALCTSSLFRGEKKQRSHDCISADRLRLRRQRGAAFKDLVLKELSNWGRAHAKVTALVTWRFFQSIGEREVNLYCLYEPGPIIRMKKSQLKGNYC